MTNSNILSSVSSEIRTTGLLSQEQVAQYHEDGFVIIPRFFDTEEIEPALSLGFWMANITLYSTLKSFSNQENLMEV